MKTIKQELTEILSKNENARSYSGRGMYGEKCVGIVGSSFSEIFSNVVDDIFYSADDSENNRTHELMQLVMRFKHDSMGKDMIVYWEQLGRADESDSNDEGEE